MSPQELRARMTRDITTISASLTGAARATLDRYLSTFNKHGDEGVFPVTPRPHASDPMKCTEKHSDAVLFHLIGTMIARYWAFAQAPSIHLQRAWDAVHRKVHKIANKGLDAFSVVGSDSDGYALVPTELVERLADAASPQRRRTPKPTAE